MYRAGVAAYPDLMLNWLSWRLRTQRLLQSVDSPFDRVESFVLSRGLRHDVRELLKR